MQIEITPTISRGGPYLTRMGSIPARAVILLAGRKRTHKCVPVMSSMLNVINCRDELHRSVPSLTAVRYH
jgi:hypothetical protein